MLTEKKWLIVFILIAVIAAILIISLPRRKSPEQPYITEVHVKSGKVAVQSEGDAQKIIQLGPGEKAIIGRKDASDKSFKSLLEEIEKLKAIIDDLKNKNREYLAEIESLRAELEREREAKRQAAQDAEKTLQAAAETGVHGYVYDQKGHPAEGVTVSFSDFLDKQDVSTDESGYYKTNGLKEGFYTVACGLYPDEKPRIMVYSGKMTTLNFKTGDKVHLFGYLHDENRQPFSTDISITNSMHKTYRTSSNENGYYEFKNIPRDTYSVEINWGSRFESDTALPIEIPDDATEHRHDISLSAATISGKIIFKDTKEPVIGAHIRARSSTGIAYTHSDEKGFYWFGNPTRRAI